MEAVVKWEYAIQVLVTENMEAMDKSREWMNRAGAQGWELVSVDNGIAYFKRPLRPKSENELLYEIDRGRASLV